MKSFTIKECKKCGAQKLDEDEIITINPQEDVEIIIVATMKCNQCKLKQIRTVSGIKIPFHGI